MCKKKIKQLLYKYDNITIGYRIWNESHIEQIISKIAEAERSNIII